MPPGRGSTYEMVSPAVARAGGVGSARAISVYTVAADTAPSLDEATACLAAEGIMRNLTLPLLRVLADEKDSSATLRQQLRLNAIEARVARILAIGELKDRTDAKQDQKWVIDKWVVIAVAAGGWLAAVTVALIAVLLR